MNSQGTRFDPVAEKLLGKEPVVFRRMGRIKDPRKEHALDTIEGLIRRTMDDWLLTTKRMRMVREEIEFAQLSQKELKSRLRRMGFAVGNRRWTDSVIKLSCQSEGVIVRIEALNVKELAHAK